MTKQATPSKINALNQHQQAPATNTEQNKALVYGQPSEAQISPNSTEVILKYNPKQPIINHI
jgi:hypothetical protein